MKKAQGIIDEIILIETLLFDEEAYLDEAQQARIHSLYQVLGRKLNEEERSIIYSRRLDYMEECLGEKSEENLNKKMYYQS